MVPKYMCSYCNQVFDSDWSCELHERDAHKCPNCKYAEYTFGKVNCKRYAESKTCKFESKKGEK